ncbi:MAG: hypothetical protein ACM3ZB_03695 [bacterium]
MTVLGPEILARALSKPAIVDRHGNTWNYHSRSDRHSKVACWAITFDLLRTSRLLREHAAAGSVAFGINVEIRDFQHDRKKDLDLVVCQPATAIAQGARTLATLADHYSIELSKRERAELRALPEFREAQVGSVLVALEAKACMTAHQRALPRLYDELNSSHATVHGAYDSAIAGGIVMVNIAERFLSPDLNKENRASRPVWSSHDQPKSVEITLDKVRQLPRRSKTGIPGYDALAIIVVECENDGSAVKLHSRSPAPQPQDTYHYAAMIDRLKGIYATRFAQL